MSKRRKRAPDPIPTPVAEPTGVAKLLSEMPRATLDLHGLTRAEAQVRVRNFLTTHSRISSGGVVHIITGKGTRSVATPVLRDLVRDLLGGEMEERIADRAGLPGGGGWVVRLR